MVTCDYVVIHIFQNNIEFRYCGVKFRAKFFGLAGGAFLYH